MHYMNTVPPRPRQLWGTLGESRDIPAPTDRESPWGITIISDYGTTINMISEHANEDISVYFVVICFGCMCV